MSERNRVHPVLVLATALSLNIVAGCDEPKPQPEQSTAALQSQAAASAKLQEILAKQAAEKAKKKDEPAVEGADIECAEGSQVDFHDKVLEQEVRRKLGKPEGEIAKSELAKIRSINLAKGDPVNYLDPCVFPHLTGVKDLFLGPGKVSDLSLLSKLTRLESLRAAMNRVSDVSPLSNLKNLDRLDLANTPVTDISPLASLTNLTELQLDGSQVSDISPLANLKKLERLTLNRTQVKDISPLRSITTLKSVNVSGAPVSDPEAIARRGLEIIDN